MTRAASGTGAEPAGSFRSIDAAEPPDQIVGFTERLADHPVGVEIHLPVVVVAAIRPHAQDRAGGRELQDVHVRRGRGQHVGDRRQPLLRIPMAV